MDRIAFLISDLSMQQSVHTILETYKEKLEQHHFIIDVEIIDFPNLVAQAHVLVDKGTKVIITTSGAHQILTKAIDRIPILCLYSSTNDALYALRAIAPKYKKIHLLLNENFMFNKDACPPELSEKIVFYPRYSHRRLSPAAANRQPQPDADLFHQAQRIDDAVGPALRPGAPGL